MSLDGMKLAARLVATLSLFALLAVPRARAEVVHEAVGRRVALLTCSPGQTEYELYGHTAILVTDEQGRDDRVYNYGIFSFDRPHFLWRFILGQTDYTMDAAPADAFLWAYLAEGRSVEAQWLNLTAAEAERLTRALEANAAVPGWTYRYNFFYDNCTTRAVDAIVAAIDGRVEWPKADSTRTFRRVLHEFTTDSPWQRFGQDLVIGAEADRPTGIDQQLFSPIYASRIFDGAVIVASDGSRRPLVSDRSVQEAGARPDATPTLMSPMAMCVLLLCVVALAGQWGYRRRRRLRVVDYVLLLAQGLTGCIVAFLFFLSEHPAVGSNWIVLLFNPLPLVLLPVVAWRDRRGCHDVLPVCEGLLVLLFLAAVPFARQNFPAEVYFLACTLLLRCVSLALINRRLLPGVGGQKATSGRQ